MTEFKPEEHRELIDYRKNWLREAWEKLPEEDKAMINQIAQQRGISIQQVLVRAIRISNILELAQRSGLEVIIEETPDPTRKISKSPLFITETTFTSPEQQT